MASCIVQTLRDKEPETGLRSYLDLLSRHGLLLRVDREVDRGREVGEITRSCGSPVLFTNLKDYRGWRVFANGLCRNSLIGLALGMAPGTGRREVAREIRRRLSSPIPPRLVEYGPVYENIETDAIDLNRLAVPHWHPLDRGRYLGTWHLNITQDPEDHTCNAGVYRMELLGARQATVSTSPSSHLGRHLAKARKMGRKLPMAVAIGVSELAVMAAGSGSAPMNEFEVAGALAQSPLRLVRCKTIDLEVPADSEVVVEGFLHSDRFVQDGPYFDYTGVANINPRACLFEATAILFRNDPIFRGASIGRPGAEDHQILAALADVGLFDFHWSTLKGRMQGRAQSWFLRRRWFRAFQACGRKKNPFR